MPETSHSADDSGREFTIDELAAETKVPSRTIRFYQSKRALPAPQRRGRRAVYTEEHVGRLQLIARLQDQGLTIKAIRGLLSSSDRGEIEMSSWLGLTTELQTPWADDSPRVVTRDALIELTGTDREGLIAELVREGLIERVSDRFSVLSPALLAVTMRLEGAGVELATSAEAARALRRHLAKAAEDVSRLFLRQLRPAATDETNPDRLAEVFDTLRPVGLEAVRLIFAQEMERALQEALASGRATDAVRKSP